MKFELSRRSEYTKQNIADELIKVDRKLKKGVLTQKDVIQNSSIGSRDAIIKLFGTFEEALKYAGLGDKFSGRRATKKQQKQIGKRISKEDVIMELIRIADKIGNTVLRVEDVNENSAIISASTVRAKFGSFPNGLAEAGLQLSKSGNRYTQQNCFENLQKVWLCLGRQPKYSEMNTDISSVRGKVYSTRWGSWLKALEAFIDYIESDDESLSAQPVLQSNINKKGESTAPEDKRNIPDKLRLKIFLRDDFTCVYCGRSPANEKGVPLHVDHIIPFAKGGKTVSENLQTLCKNCNLGKGADIIDA